jgi:type I restriction enzyme, R subunit
MTSTFTEERLELAIIELLGEQGYPHLKGEEITRENNEVLIKEDLHSFLSNQHSSENITTSEIERLINELESLSSADLYESNKQIMKKVSDGFLLRREDETQQDIFINLIDYSVADNNYYKIVNQMEIVGSERRIPDGILYINGLPLVVFEFKSAIREEEATIADAYVQLTTRYKRDIPELFKYNALCVISDGVNNKMGSFFAPYEYFYAWRKITGEETVDREGIDSLITMVEGLFDRNRLREVIRHFVYFPDSSRSEQKIVCRYPQYYAANKLYENIKLHRKPEGDGKGGTYFGATGCGKSFTMLFLSRLLMRSVDFESPTIVLITDRIDLDDQLSGQFTGAKDYIGDQTVISVKSRAELRSELQGRNSGGVFLTTIHKFSEDTQLLTDRDNVICISDEAHRSQLNLDQKIIVTTEGVKRKFGFAKYLHDSLPNATYVGFTGTPIDATLDVFGEVVDTYTMTESVSDEITVPIVYEGRAAKVLLESSKLQEIEAFYKQCAETGTNEEQIEASKRAMAQMSSILGDPDRIKALAEDFVNHYETRVNEGSTIKGKAMFVSSSRKIAYTLYKEVIALRPEWGEEKECDEGVTLTEAERQGIMPMEKIKMVMTRDKDDEPELYEMLGTSDYRKELDRQFKNGKSNFKIAIIVDMWLTGFDVPFLDTMYIDKPVQKHNLIQTISRVNRKFEQKEKGLIIDYVGIKTQMNLALAYYSKKDSQNFEDIAQSIVVLRDHLDLLNSIFHKFDSIKYFNGSSLEQLHCLNRAVEFVQVTKEMEQRFMSLTKIMKAAYDICSGSSEITEDERNWIHFYIAVRSILYKLTPNGGLDTFRMNKKVREMIDEALQSDGVQQIFKLGSDEEFNLFDKDYLEKIKKIKLPNTKVKVLQWLLTRIIDNFKKINKFKGMDFSKKFQELVEKYNDRKEQDVLVSDVLKDFTDEIIALYNEIKEEQDSFEGKGITFEEKAFYDILQALTIKYDFTYPENKLIELSKAVREVVDTQARHPDWNQRHDIKAALKVDLILLLADHGYPPVDEDEVYKEIFEQAENYKINQQFSMA